MAQQTIAMPWLRHDTQWAFDLMEKIRAIWQSQGGYSQRLYRVGQLINEEYPLNPLFKLGRFGQVMAWVAGQWNPAPVTLAGMYKEFEILQASQTYMREGTCAHVGRVQDESGATTLMEVGCGQGHTLLKLAPYFQKVTGVDLYLPFLEEAERIAAQQGFYHATFQHGDGRDLRDLGDEYADITLSVLATHYFNLGEMVQLIRELLRTSREAVVLMEIKYRRINPILAMFKLFPLWTPFSWRFYRHGLAVLTKSPTENRLQMAIGLANADGKYSIETSVHIVKGVMPYYLVTIRKT